MQLPSSPPPRPRSPELSVCSSYEESDIGCRTGGIATPLKTSFMTTSSSDRSTTDRAEHTALGAYRARTGPVRLKDVRSEAQLRFATDLQESPSLDTPTMMAANKRYSLRRTLSRKDCANARSPTNISTPARLLAPRIERRDSIESGLLLNRRESSAIASRRHTIGTRRKSEVKATRRNSEMPISSTVAKVRGARSFFVKRTIHHHFVVEDDVEESVRKLSRWTSTPVMDAADVEDARATFARCRNRAAVWGVASSPPPAPDALDAFTPALARVADTRGLGRTLRALCATLPARTAFVHRDSLWRAADLAGNHGGAQQRRRVKRNMKNIHDLKETGEIVALCPFGDALALAAVAAAARGRVGVRRRVRRHSGLLHCSLILRNAKAQVRVDVCETASERAIISVYPATWPRRREINERLHAEFRAEWNTLAANAPEISGSSRHSSSRTFRRLSRR